MGAVGEKTVKGIMNKYGVRELYDLLVSHYITALSVNMRPILCQITFNKKGTDFLCTGVHVQYQNSLVSK